MRILVFTISAWNNLVGDNTWISLLEQYKGRSDIEIANICIRDEMPDSEICSNYFAISESKIIRSIFNRKIKTGERKTPNKHSQSDIDYLSEHNKRYAKMTRHRRYSMLMARELVWKLGKWKTKELDEFLDSFKPDLILHGMSGYIHLNRITEYSIKRCGAKAVGYIMDDTFTYKQSSALGYKLLRFFQIRSLKRLAKETQSFFAISPMTKKEADEAFDIDCRLLTKPLNSIPHFSERKVNTPISILYTGNLLIGRDRSLVKLARALKKVNSDEIYYTLDVYTPTILNEDDASELSSEFVNIHSPIPQSEALQKQKDADILLFLEDIDGKDAKTARLSFSTKLTDYLSTGNAIFAIGNKDTAPMNYLILNNAAFVCDSEREIERNLTDILNDNSLLDGIRKNACDCAVKNHNSDAIYKLFDNTLQWVLTYNF